MCVFYVFGGPQVPETTIVIGSWRQGVLIPQVWRPGSTRNYYKTRRLLIKSEKSSGKHRARKSYKPVMTIEHCVLYVLCSFIIKRGAEHDKTRRKSTQNYPNKCYGIFLAVFFVF